MHDSLTSTPAERRRAEIDAELQDSTSSTPTSTTTLFHKDDQTLNEPVSQAESVNFEHSESADLGGSGSATAAEPHPQPRFGGSTSPSRDSVSGDRAESPLSFYDAASHIDPSSPESPKSESSPLTYLAPFDMAAPNGMNAGAGPPYGLGGAIMPSAGHHNDMQYVWTLVEELSGQLQANRERWTELQDGIARAQVHTDYPRRLED